MKREGMGRSWKWFIVIMAFAFAWGLVSSASAKDLIAASIRKPDQPGLDQHGQGD